MKAKEVTVGVLGAKLGEPDRLLVPEQRRLLEFFASIIAMALIRSSSPIKIDETYNFRYEEI